MRHLESQHQQAYFRWAYMHPVARKAFAIPNGGARSKVTASILKAEGVKAGVFDIFLPVPAGQCHGLFIEMKFGDNTMSKPQKDFGNNLVADGYMAVVAYDWAKAREWTLKYLEGTLAPALVVDR